MSNFTQLIARPILNDCSFNAVGNPIVYTLRREDFHYVVINNHTGNAHYVILGGDFTSYFEVGDTVYAETGGVSVVTHSNFSGGNTLVRTTLPFPGSDDGYINNLSKRTDYSVELQVLDFSGSALMGPRLVGSPSQDGFIKFDVSGVLKSYVYADWTQPTLNETETSTAKRFYINYQEFYDDTYWEEISDAANPVFAVFAVMHLLQNPTNYVRYPYGGNMLGFYQLDITRKFLCTFPPTVWRGWPFSVSMLHKSTTLARVVWQFDSEGATIDILVTGLNAHAEDIDRVSLPTILDNTDAILFTVNNAEEQVFENLRIKVRNACDNPVYLFWKNARGGDTFWMFDESQDYEYTYPSGRRVKRLKLFADNLTIDEWEGINQLNSATEVIANNIVDYNMDDSVDRTHFRNDNQVFIINQDESKTGVIVVASQSETKSSYRKTAIEITIELPEYFTV